MQQCSSGGQHQALLLGCLNYRMLWVPCCLSPALNAALCRLLLLPSLLAGSSSCTNTLQAAATLTAQQQQQQGL
jgi:hypothetical protein